MAAQRYVAIYTRISKDKYGNAETCTDQEARGRSYAERTWPGMPVRVFSDPDLSASRDDVVRPGFEALKEALGRGEVAQLWAVEQTRLERREIAWFELAMLLDVAGIELMHTHRDGIVRVQDEVAGIKAVLAAAEIRRMKARIADKLDAHAARGLPPGSRGYGYVHGRDDVGERTYLVVPEQAEVLRECADLVLGGWAQESIARMLRERGVQGAHRVKVRDEHGQVVTDERGNPVTRPSQISGATIKRMLTNPEPDPRPAPVRLAALSFPPIGVWQRAEKITRDAAAALRAATDPAEVAGIARAAADLLTAAAHQWEGKRGGPLTEAAEVFDRAAYDQHIHALRDHLHVTRLRGMARFLLVNAVMARSDDIDAAFRFYYTMAVLIDNLADIRDAQRRLHQAHAARDAAGRLRSWRPPVAATPTSPAASGRQWRQPGPSSPQQRTAGRRQP